MDCQSDENKCDEIFGECRCYADVNSEDPKNAQICGIRKNGYVCLLYTSPSPRD